MEDYEFRLKLAKSIGYSGIPLLDPTAFDRLKGMCSDLFDPCTFDAVELIREIRD